MNTQENNLEINSLLGSKNSRKSVVAEISLESKLETLKRKYTSNTKDCTKEVLNKDSVKIKDTPILLT